MNNAVFGKIMKNVRNHRDIKLVTTKARRNYSKSKPNNFFFSETLLAIEMKRKQH